MHNELKMSLKTLKDFQDDVPEIGNFPDRLLVDDYESFVSVLHKDIEIIRSKMEENPELLSEDSEDRLTIEIKNMLSCMGYNSSHDTKIGGHSDLSVKKRNWLWIAEAKIHNSYEYLLQGFLQLTTRYSLGGENNCEGGMLIYIKTARAKNVMDNWKNHLINNKLEKISKTYDCPMNKLAFYSEHNHQRTDLTFKVRHIPFCLHFDPKDRTVKQ